MICLPVCLPACLCLTVYLSDGLPVCLSVCLTVYLSDGLPVCLQVFEVRTTEELTEEWLKEKLGLFS